MENQKKYQKKIELVSSVQAQYSWQTQNASWETKIYRAEVCSFTLCLKAE